MSTDTTQLNSNQMDSFYTCVELYSSIHDYKPQLNSTAMEFIDMYGT
jgi:hypothetical protein